MKKAQRAFQNVSNATKHKTYTHLFTYLLTYLLHGAVFLVKLTGFAVIKKFPAIYGT